MRAAAVVIIGFLIASAGVTAASARTPHPPSGDECVPTDAVAYQAAVYTTVHHDAVTETVYNRYSWTPERHDNADDAPDVTGSTPGTDADHWQVDGKHDPKGDPVGVAFIKGHGENASWFFWVGAQKVVKDAYDEQVLVSPEIPGVDAVTCPDPEPEILTEWYTWDTGAWTPDATNADDTSWPQTLVGQGKIAPTACETTYQQDKYVGTREAIDAVIADGMLTHTGQPEDYLIVKQWLFVSTEACPPVLVEVTPTAPTVVPTCGPDNDAVTVPTMDGVVYSDTGWVSGERTITATADEGYTLTGTTSWTYTDEATVCPEEVTAVAASVVDPPICGPNNDVINIPTTEGVVYADTGWVEGERTITASAMEGYVLTGTTSWTFTDEATLCPIDETGGEVATAAPTVVAKCFPNNDTVTIPEIEGVSYSDTGWANGLRTITATPDEGYTLIGVTTWTFTDVPSAGCAPAGPAFAADELAFTGAPSNTGGLATLAMLLITSGTAVVVRKRRVF